MAIPRLTITQHDGTEITVTPNLFDTFAFEKMLKANPRLGGLQDNTLKLQSFRGWSAAKRTGLIDQTWEDFSGSEQAALQVVAADEPEVDAEAVLGLGLDTPQAQ